MKIKIEKGIPLPPRRNASLYSLFAHKLAVGDSIFLDGVSVARASNGMYQWNKKLKIKTVCRKENGGVRIWRIK